MNLKFCRVTFKQGIVNLRLNSIWLFNNMVNMVELIKWSNEKL